jgi:hypothetical protein
MHTSQCVRACMCSMLQTESSLRGSERILLLSFQRDCRIQKISCSFCVKFIRVDVNVVEVSLSKLSISLRSGQKRYIEARCCSLCVTRECCKSVRMWERTYAICELAYGIRGLVLRAHCLFAALRKPIASLQQWLTACQFLCTVLRKKFRGLVLFWHRDKYRHWEW